MNRIIVISFLLIGLNSLAQTDFEKAVVMSNRKEYDKAANVFLKLATQTPENTSAYFNAGNCFRHMNQNGKAIWAYFKVLKVNPSDQEAAKNIEDCREYLKLTDTPFQIATQFEVLLIRVGLRAWTYLSIFLSIVFSTYIFFVVRKNTFSRQPMLRIVGITSFVLLCFSIFFANATQAFMHRKSFGIIVEKSAPVFVNDLGERTTLALPEGTMVKFEGLTKTKTSVKLQNGKNVFLRETDIRWI